MGIQTAPVFQFSHISSSMSSNGIPGIKMFITRAVVIPFITFMDMIMEVTTFEGNDGFIITFSYWVSTYFVIKPIHKSNSHFSFNPSSTCRRCMKIPVSSSASRFKMTIMMRSHIGLDWNQHIYCGSIVGAWSNTTSQVASCSTTV